MDHEPTGIIHKALKAQSAPAMLSPWHTCSKEVANVMQLASLYARRANFSDAWVMEADS